VARTVRDSILDTRAARGRLHQSGKPYYRAIDAGLHVGYRKGKAGGKWVARWYVGNQDYRVETIAIADDVIDADGATVLNFSQAQAAARKLFTDRKREQVGLPSADAGPYTVKACIEEYLAWMEENRKSAADSRYKANALIIPELGDTECAKLTAKQIQDWLHATAKRGARLRSKKGKAPKHRELPNDDEGRRPRRATANRVLTILKAALNRAWSVEGGEKIPSDSAWRKVKPFEGVDAARIRYLSIDEAKRLINGSARDFRELVQGALATGARYGELGRFNVDDFNPDSGTLRVVVSKGGKFRHIVLSTEGMRFFRNLAAGRPSDEPMFKRDDGERWGPSHQRRRMQEACAAARVELKHGEAIHVLRHTYASHAIMNGAPLLVVAKNLGHRDTRMVEKHYGHLAPSFEAAAIRAAAPKFGLKHDCNVRALRA